MIGPMFSTSSTLQNKHSQSEIGARGINLIKEQESVIVNQGN